MIYVDSSALLKLIVEEAESAALATFLCDRRPEPVISSALIRFEVPRAVARRDKALASQAFALVEQLDLVPVDGVLPAAAAVVGDPELTASTRSTSRRRCRASKRSRSSSPTTGGSWRPRMTRVFA